MRESKRLRRFVKYLLPFFFLCFILFLSAKLPPIKSVFVKQAVSFSDTQTQAQFSPQDQSLNRILIKEAYQLDENGKILSDITELVKIKDDRWATITNNQYIRVIFEKPLDSTKDIMLYARSNSETKSAQVKVFTKGSNELLATFENVGSTGEYKVYLTNLIQPTDTFDLKITGNIGLDLITDPYIWTEHASLGKLSWTSVASSADGNKIVAVECGDYTWDDGYIHTSTDGGSTWTTRTNAGLKCWNSVTSSSDGTKLAAVVGGEYSGYIYTSTDSGATWNERTSSGSRDWSGIASSSDGTKLIASSYQGYLYTSTDSGATWDARTSAGSRKWNPVDSSSDGIKLIAGVDYSGYIYTSTDSGVTWNAKTNSGLRGWKGATISDDGTKMAACVGNGRGYIYISGDSGATWTEKTVVGLGYWLGIISSSDGTKLIAIDQYGDFSSGRIFNSNNSGETWTQQTNTPLAYYNNIAATSDFNKLIAADTYGIDWNGGYIYTAVLDSTAPIISLTPLSSDPNSDTTPSLVGTATDDIGTVSTVQYQMDSTAGSWSSCTADDGAFDEASDAFTCAVSPALADGAHTIYVRATDSNTNTTSSGSETSDSFTIDATAPINLTLDSPSGYSKDGVKPTLVFKKATDATSGIASYSVSLDSGKNQNWSTTGIPSTGDTSKSSYIWKDDSLVKIEFLNENDSDASNDQIRVYFKGLDSSELTEGTHSWKVIAYDSAGNSKEESKEFYLDKTNPSISELAIADLSTVTGGGVYTLKSSQLTLSFSGLASDSYQGSTKTNTNGTTDTFSKVSSGPQTITLTLKKLTSGSPINNPVWADHLTKEYSLVDITDKANNQKEARFYITTPYPLVDGYYQATLTLKDQAGNSYSYPAFYLSLNYSQSALRFHSGQASQTAGKLKTEITKQEQIPYSEEEQSASTAASARQGEGVTVQVTVIDESLKPVPNAKVELHSDPMISYTNDQGIATFTHVQRGDHTIKIAYNNYQGEQKVTLEGDTTKQFNFEIKVVEEKIPFWRKPVFLIPATLLSTVIVLFFFFLIWKKRNSKN